MSSLTRTIALAARSAVLALPCVGASQGPAPSEHVRPEPQKEPGRAAVEALLQKNIYLDLQRALCSIPATVGVRDDLLEYILVNPHGATHESLLETEVDAIDLNAALVLLGVEPGQNARWLAVDPAPSPEAIRSGAAPWTVEPPRGDGFYLYAAWRAQGETYLYRVEDLMRNLETGRAMQRHRWVYLGSRWAKLRKDGEEIFAARAEGNLVNLTFFEQGNTLLTGTLPECLKQTIWLPNAWLLPQRGEKVELLLSRERLASIPADLEARLPEITADSPGGR